MRRRERHIGTVWLKTGDLVDMIKGHGSQVEVIRMDENH